MASAQSDADVDVARRHRLRRPVLALLIAVPLVVLPVLLVGAVVAFISVWEPQVRVDRDSYEPLPAGVEVLYEHEAVLNNGAGPENFTRTLLIATPKSADPVAVLAQHFRTRGYRDPLVSDPGHFRSSGPHGQVNIGLWQPVDEAVMTSVDRTEEEEAMVRAAAGAGDRPIALVTVAPPGTL